jgi:hypothetical protein
MSTATGRTTRTASTLHYRLTIAVPLILAAIILACTGMLMIHGSDNAVAPVPAQQLAQLGYPAIPDTSVPVKPVPDANGTTSNGTKLDAHGFAVAPDHY